MSEVHPTFSSISLKKVLNKFNVRAEIHEGKVCPPAEGAAI